MAEPYDSTKDREALQKEYERIATDIRGIETTNDKAVGFGLTIVGIGVAYGVKENLTIVFLFLPIALMGVFLYGTLQYHNLFWLGGYKRAIEDKINELAGRRLIFWETLVQKNRGRVNVINVGPTIVYLGITVAITGISTVKVFLGFGMWIGLLLGSVEAALGALLFFGVRRTFRGYDEAYQQSCSALLLPTTPTRQHAVDVRPDLLT